MNGITIYRPPSIWMDRNRLYRIEVDGSIVGEVWPNQSAFIALSPGAHTIKVKIDFMSSNELQVEIHPGDAVRLVCRGSGSVVALFRTLFKWKSYLTLERAS